MSGHTPGPWVARDLRGRGVTVHSNNEGGSVQKNICHIPLAWKNQADARLIAASPDLYQASLMALAAFRGEVSPSVAEHALEEALRKAGHEQ